MTKGKGWHGEPRRHGLARKGVKTVIDKDTRLAVNNYVARGIYRGKVMVTHLRADNDPNGNPQRLYVINNSKGEIIDVIDEGYYGSSAFRKTYPNYVEVATYNIPKSEYHELKREWKSKNQKCNHQWKNLDNLTKVCTKCTMLTKR